MHDAHYTVTLTRDGTLTLESIPFRAGERVNVTLEPAPCEANSADSLYPLRGVGPYSFDDPFSPAITPQDCATDLAY